jgi:hypothetical protein
VPEVLHCTFECRLSWFTTATSAASYCANTTEQKMTFSPPWHPSQHAVVELRIKDALGTTNLKLAESAYWSYDTAKNDMIQYVRDEVEDRPLGEEEIVVDWHEIDGVRIAQITGNDGEVVYWETVAVQAETGIESA